MLNLNLNVQDTNANVSFSLLNHHHMYCKFQSKQNVMQIEFLKHRD